MFHHMEAVLHLFFCKFFSLIVDNAQFCSNPFFKARYILVFSSRCCMVKTIAALGAKCRVVLKIIKFGFNKRFFVSAAALFFRFNNLRCYVFQ